MRYYTIIAISVVVITRTVTSTATESIDSIQSLDDVKDVLTALQQQHQEQGRDHERQLADICQRNEAQLADMRHRYDAELADMRQENLVLRERIEVLENAASHTAEQSQKGVISSFGCPTDEISLSCSDNKTIFITNAEYGQNYQSCADGTCCPPHPLACTQNMADSSPDDWVYLKLLCDNQTSCSYLFQGSTFTDDICTPLDSVAYLDIYYSCMPEYVAEPVGFSAFTAETLTYNQDDVIQFPYTFSNFGGYYNPASGLFTCPYDGIYMFFSNIHSEDTNVNCRICKESSYLVRMLSPDVGTAGNLAITGCNMGERVWVRQTQGSDTISGSRSSTFSGFLLHRY